MQHPVVTPLVNALQAVTTGIILPGEVDGSPDGLRLADDFRQQQGFVLLDRVGGHCAWCCLRGLLSRLRTGSPRLLEMGLLPPGIEYPLTRAGGIRALCHALSLSKPRTSQARPLGDDWRLK